jgi:hypothetical protein
MIHAKAITQGHTMGWTTRCSSESKKSCYVGFSWPNSTKSETVTYDPETKMDYNCFVNKKVEYYWIPRLNKAVEARRRDSKY